MPLCKSKAGVLTISLCGIAGIAAVWGQDYDGQSNQPPHAALDERQADAATAKGSKTNDEIKALLAARAALARKGYESAFAGVTETERINNRLIRFRQPEDAYAWSLRWLQAERDLAHDQGGQVAALEAHLKRASELETKVKSLSRSLLPKWAIWEAEWHRLDAELWLAQAKTK